MVFLPTFAMGDFLYCTSVARKYHHPFDCLPLPPILNVLSIKICLILAQHTAGLSNFMWFYMHYNLVFASPFRKYLHFFLLVRKHWFFVSKIHQSIISLFLMAIEQRVVFLFSFAAKVLRLSTITFWTLNS